jgi:glycosyltransferase involved in cell wall biosynthesis
MPAYNEAEVIAEVVQKWTDLLKSKFNHEDARLIVVNDGSKDKTGRILDVLAGQNHYLIALTQPNGGHGRAVVTAYNLAIEHGCDYVFQTDSDDQFETTDFWKLWEQREKSNFILGYRKIRFDAPIRLIITRIVRLVLWLFYGVTIPDSNIPFRLIKTNVLKEMLRRLPKPLPFAPNIFLSVMACRDGNELLNIPITHKNRHTGEVSIKKWNLLKVCWRSYKELMAFRTILDSKIK